MADLVVDTYKLKQYAQRLSAVRSRISNLEYRMDLLYNEVGLQDLWNLLRNDPLTKYSKRLKQCRNYLEDTASDFESVESKLLKLDPTNFSPIHGVVYDSPILGHDGILHKAWRDLRYLSAESVVGMGAAESAVPESLWSRFLSGDLATSERYSFLDKESEDGESYIGLFNAFTSASAGLEYGKYKDKSKLGDEDHLNIKKSQEKKPYYQKNEDEDWYDDKAIIEAKAEASAKVSVVSGKLSGEGKYAQGSVEGDLLTAEAHAGASAGLYVYTKDKDGNVVKMFSPGVSAEVGASASVLHVGAEGRVGLGEDNNMLGLYGNVSADVLTAEAKGKVAINRKEVYAGASAEADIAKVTATGGVAVLGTDIGVTGSLKVGVGAHAEIGITDGKVKVDVGAAVGVGFDVGFEVDVSGTVDAVVDKATAAWDIAVDAWDETKDVVAEAWDNTKDAVSDAWDNTKDAVSDAWNDTKDEISKKWKNWFG